MSGINLTSTVSSSTSSTQNSQEYGVLSKMVKQNFLAACDSTLKLCKLFTDLMMQGIDEKKQKIIEQYVGEMGRAMFTGAKGAIMCTSSAASFYKTAKLGSEMNAAGVRPDEIAADINMDNLNDRRKAARALNKAGSDFYTQVGHGTASGIDAFGAAWSAGWQSSAGKTEVQIGLLDELKRAIQTMIDTVKGTGQGALGAGPISGAGQQAKAISGR